MVNITINGVIKTKNPLVPNFNFNISTENVKELSAVYQNLLHISDAPTLSTAEYERVKSDIKANSKHLLHDVEDRIRGKYHPEALQASRDVIKDNIGQVETLPITRTGKLTTAYNYPHDETYADHIVTAHVEPGLNYKVRNGDQHPKD